MRSILNIPAYLKISRHLIATLILLFGLVMYVEAQTNQTVVNGSFTTQAIFPSGTCGYSWTNSAPSIGLPASGTGNIASFKAINTGTAPITATITATPVQAALVYVANSVSNDVSVVSTGTKTVVATIPVGHNPFGATVSPDGRTVYITNKDDASVSVIDVYTNTVTATIMVNAGPQGIAASPNGNYLYVACGNANNIAVVNIATKTVIANIAVGLNPYGIILSPNGALAYVTNYGGRSVSVINTAFNSVVSTIGTGDNPAGVVTSPDGNTVYVATSGANKLTIINASNNTIAKELTVSNNPIAITINADGSEVFMTGLSGFMNIVELAYDWVIGTASPGGQGVSFMPDHSYFYYTDKINNRLSYTAADIGSGGIISPLGNGPTSFGNFIAPGPPCNLPTVTFTIQVDPSPNIQLSAVTGTISSCLGEASASPNIQQFAVSGSGLNTNIDITAPTNFEISLNAYTGYTNNISLPAIASTISSTNIYVRSAANAPAGSLTDNISCTSTGATSKLAAVSATINQIPAINPIGNQVLPAGSTTTGVNFTGTATLYKWVNNMPGIGLAASGTGSISSFTAINNTHSPIVATITVTPYSGNCIGSATNFNITVNPAPVITANANLTTITAEYGTLIPSVSFSMSGANLTTGIVVVAPPGFEVSNDNISFGSTITVGTGGDVTATTIYFRLKTAADVNTYAGSILLSSTGATDVSVIIPNIVITPAPLTITPDNITKTYGQVLQDSPVSTAFKITEGGLKNGNTLTTVAINYGAGAAGNANVGSYPTVVAAVKTGRNGFIASNYSINTINGNIIVLPAPLTITADNKSKIYKSMNPVLTASYKGFVNNENISVLSIKPVINTIATTISEPGEYPITVMDAAADNYMITYIDGLLTINPLPPEIIPPNAFTPNGDGINDMWEIPALAAYPNCVVKLYSRWGKLIFQSTGYSKPWDGMYGNRLMTAGTYYYIIDLGDHKKPISGILTLVR